MSKSFVYFLKFWCTCKTWLNFPSHLHFIDSSHNFIYFQLHASAICTFQDIMFLNYFSGALKKVKPLISLWRLQFSFLSKHEERKIGKENISAANHLDFELTFLRFVFESHFCEGNHLHSRMPSAVKNGIRSFYQFW